MNRVETEHSFEHEKGLKNLVLKGLSEVLVNFSRFYHDLSLIILISHDRDCQLLKNLKFHLVSYQIWGKVTCFQRASLKALIVTVKKLRWSLGVIGLRVFH